MKSSREQIIRFEKRDQIIVVIASLVLMVSSVLLPAGIFLVVFVATTVLLLFRIKVWNFIVPVCILLGIARLISMLILMNAVQSLPLEFASPRALAFSRIPFSLFIYPDIAQFEANIELRRTLVGKQSAGRVQTFGWSMGEGLSNVEDFSAIDPFTGLDYPETVNGELYSIGPDLLDQNCKTVYDPTNGTFSLGDIPLEK